MTKILLFQNCLRPNINNLDAQSNDMPSEMPTKRDAQMPNQTRCPDAQRDAYETRCPIKRYA